MSSREAKELKPLRHAWAVHLDYADFYLDEAISGYVELVVQDVYMARTIELNLMQYITVKVSDKYERHLRSEGLVDFSLVTDVESVCLERRR